jgi:phosphatidylserine/phosphatidylglycerophosphate/cardiolipin synthase-like enzyme
MELGVNVHILDRLHAKVLIVDDQYAFFGSQNFTNYSTESIEITTQIDRTDDVDEFFDYFLKLKLFSREVTLEELNEAAGSNRYKTSEDDEDDSEMMVMIRKILDEDEVEDEDEDEETDFNRI